MNCNIQCKDFYSIFNASIILDRYLNFTVSSFLGVTHTYRFNCNLRSLGKSTCNKVVFITECFIFVVLPIYYLYVPTIFRFYTLTCLTVCTYFGNKIKSKYCKHGF